MDEAKWKRLRSIGWRQGSAADLLDLSPEDEAYIELKLRLSGAVRSWRRRKRMTQVELAERMGSSQSRVAKIESGHPSVSLDLMAKSLLALGATQSDIGREMMRGG